MVGARRHGGSCWGTVVQLRGVAEEIGGVGGGGGGGGGGSGGGSGGSGGGGGSSGGVGRGNVPFHTRTRYSCTNVAPRVRRAIFPIDVGGTCVVTDGVVSIGAVATVNVSKHAAIVAGRGVITVCFGDHVDDGHHTQAPRCRNLLFFSVQYVNRVPYRFRGQW